MNLTANIVKLDSVLKTNVLRRTLVKMKWNETATTQAQSKKENVNEKVGARAFRVH